MNPELEERIARIVNGMVLRDLPKDEVFEKLTVNGITGDAALAMYQTARQERVKTIRVRFLKKAIFGIPWLLAFVPFSGPFYSERAFETFVAILFLPMVVGLWKVINSLLWMLFAPFKKGSFDDDEA
jgi:hypothetical protein